MVREVPLAKGKVAFVDDEDWALIAQHRWRYSGGYAVTDIDGRVVSMHRLILGLLHHPGRGTAEVDHINHIGTDNRRENLRRCNIQQNSCNSANRGADSGYRGVSFWPRTGTWKVQIGYYGKNIHIGYYNTPEEAACAYDTAAQRLHGEFATLNNIGVVDTSTPPPRTRQRAPRISKYRGVHWNKNSGVWHANIGKANKIIFLGQFDDEEKAAHAYDTAARSLHGTKAHLNFPDAPFADVESQTTPTSTAFLPALLFLDPT